MENFIIDCLLLVIIHKSVFVVAFFLWQKMYTFDNKENPKRSERKKIKKISSINFFLLLGDEKIFRRKKI